MRFEFITFPEWPRLAWLARCDKTSPTITVFCGKGVETTSEWFCEAVWAGNYQSGDLDQTDIVAGSGGRLRNGNVIFVSSGSTVDRLNSLEVDHRAWISNSLSCLLATANAEVDRSYPQYFRHFRTIVGGLKRYKRFLPTTLGPAQLTYFDNLVWDGQRLTPHTKPGLGRDFSTFSRYRDFLQSSMNSIAENMANPGRQSPYQLLSTASSGYDSSTVTVLAKQADCEQVLCVDHAHEEIDLNDSGEPLANLLGLTVFKVTRSAWRDMDMPEVPFLASDSHGGDVFFRGAEPFLSGKVVLTGFHGDKIWDKHTKDLSENIVRGDQSGLSLTEYRLTAGFIHCPVPFWGVRQIRDVNALSRSPELVPWDVEGEYSRPICRRIVEEAGVPREWFGTRKRASWITFIRSKHFLSGQSLQDYISWLGHTRKDWLRQGRLPPLLSLNFDRLELGARYMLREKVSRRNGLTRLALQYTGLQRAGESIYERPTRLRRYLFPWAVQHVKKNYPRPF